MFCKYCGFEFEDDVQYCPRCGAPQIIEQNSYGTASSFNDDTFKTYSPYNGTAQRITDVLSEKAYLIVTILVTVSAVLNTLSGSLPLLDILLSIFMWMAYSSAKKGSVSYNSLRNISGTLFAEKIICFVVSGIIGFAGISVLLADKFYSAEFFDGVTAELEENGVDIESFIAEFEDKLGSVTVDNFLKVLVLVMGILMIVISVAILLYALFGIGSIHKCVKSMYKGVENGTEIVKLGACRGWVLVASVFWGLEAVGDFNSLMLNEIESDKILEFTFGIIATGCMAVAGIIAFVLLGRLKNREN